jgi:hypothetical protein
LLFGHHSDRRLFLPADGRANVVQRNSVIQGRVTQMASSCFFQSFLHTYVSLVRSSARPPTYLIGSPLAAGEVGNTCASRVCGLLLQIEKWIGNGCRPHDGHTHTDLGCIHPPGVCMRRLRTVVRRPNLDHQTQLAVERASQHASRSPADSTVLLPRRGPFWLARLRLASGSSSACPASQASASQSLSIWR